MENTPAYSESGSTRDALLSYCRTRFAQTLVDAAGSCGIRIPSLLKTWI